MRGHVHRNLHRPQSGTRTAERGNILLLAVLFLTIAASAVLTVITLVSERSRAVAIGSQDLLARQAAQGGVHQGIATVKLARNMGSAAAPFAVLENLDAKPAEGFGSYTQIIDGQPLRDTAGQTVAEFDVLVDVRNRASGSQRDVVVSCYAYVPSKAAYTAGERRAVWADAHCTVVVRFDDSNVFDYAYFINHWGWFFGNNIVANGSVRSNGQFDFGGYTSTINGSPLYTGATGTDLTGYQDDNGDGLEDGNDGGVYSGFQIVNAQNIQGMGADPMNQHENTGAITMPNLSDLSWYESQAIASGASIRVGATNYVSGVLGDGAGEKQHLYLVGTAANPIVINGPVVVRGSVVLSGVVTGRGTIYSGDNVYVARNLTYLNPPTTARPADNTEATTEAWLAANTGKDALGLFAREHIVIGNYTSSTWQSNVSSWVNNPLNKSREDAGSDGVQNTRSGADGILGTADDDVLEDDGAWTVSRYTAADAANGLIPPGKSVGDVIPGSGEDIDGDGVYDNTTQMSEFNLPASLNSTNWASNSLTTTTVAYSTISTNNLSQIDAVFYTNHTLAALMLNAGADIKMNGAIVSRNESIIYSARNIFMNHDARLNGQGGDFFGLYVPKTWAPLDLAQWEFQVAVPASLLGSADDIALYYTGN
jgi:hypothetical protein